MSCRTWTRFTTGGLSCAVSHNSDVHRFPPCKKINYKHKLSRSAPFQQHSHFKSQTLNCCALSQREATTQLVVGLRVRDWISSSDLKTCCAVFHCWHSVCWLRVMPAERRGEKGRWTCTCDRFFILFVAFERITKVCAASFTDFNVESFRCCVEPVSCRTLRCC